MDRAARAVKHAKFKLRHYRGLLLFGSGPALLSWLLEVFGEHHLPAAQMSMIVLLSVTPLLAYARHATRVPSPLLRLTLFRTRTFRVAVLGGLVTRLGVGGMPFSPCAYGQHGAGRRHDRELRAGE